MCVGIRTSSQRHGISATRAPDDGQAPSSVRKFSNPKRENIMNSIIYIVGLVVVVIAVLSFFGLR